MYTYIIYNDYYEDVIIEFMTILGYNVMDICGERDLQEPEIKLSGFISSLNYPYEYPDNSNCSCYLQVSTLSNLSRSLE